MSNSQFTKILVVLTAILVCASMMQAQSPLTYTLTPAGTTVSLTYQKGTTAGTPGPTVAALIKATSSTAFFVDPTSVPIWLGVDVMSGTANSTGVTITFSPPASYALIGAGSYHAIVQLDVIGASSLSTLSIPVTLVVTDVAPALTVTGSLTFHWTRGAGTTLPTKTLTVTSSNEPVNYTVTTTITSPTAPANWIQVDHASGVAYSWGTPVVITFNPLLAYSALTSFTGKVTITPAGGSAIDTSVAITVDPPVVAITSLYPAAIPPQATASDTDAWVVAVAGTGFVSGTTAVTVAGDVLASASVQVVNSSTMMLVIPSKKYLKTAPASVVITAKNNTADTAATATLAVTTDPIVYAVTSSASYQQTSPGGTPKVAPYELVSIFGDNFGPTGTTVVNGTPNTFGAFPTALPSTSPSTVVNFYKWANNTATFIASAPLLFVSQQQINAVVPAGVVGTTSAPITQVKISVTYNSVEGAKLLANVVAADPGIFTTAADGMGQGAILNSDYTANSSSFLAKAGNTVMIYMAGLGVPTSTGDGKASTTAAAFPKSCISTAAYMGAVNGQTNKPSPLWGTIDGAVIESSLLAKNVFPPCMAVAPTVTIGGKPATVVYAGFVADSVGGLYQINATVPTTVTAGNSVPVLVTVGTGTSAVTSQTGVTMAVAASTSTTGH